MRPIAFFTPEPFCYGVTELVGKAHDHRRFVGHFIGNFLRGRLEISLGGSDEIGIFQIAKHKLKIHLPMPVLWRDLNKRLKRSPVAQD